MRTCVIGCGAIAEEHLSYLAGAEGIDLVSVCDLSPALARIAAERHGVERFDTDVGAMLADVEPDVVHVLTPPMTHPPLVRTALDAGAHVVCEKPLAPDLDSTRCLLEAASSSGRVLVETRNLLYNDVVQRLDRLIADGRIGSVREVEVSLSLDLGGADLPASGTGLPGGIAHDYLPHLAYVFLHFTGRSEFGDVVGRFDNLSGRAEVVFDHLDALLSVGEVRGRLRISPDVLPDALRVHVRGDAGSLEADVYQPFIRHEGPPWVGKRAPFGRMVEGLTLAAAGGLNVRDRLLQHGTYHGMPRMLEAVYMALRSGAAPPVTREDMLASARLIDRLVLLGGSPR